MPRPREFDPVTVVAAAEEVFWQHGYEAAGLDRLEEATRLSRSSIYGAFGSKRSLFGAAVIHYEQTFIESLLGRVEADGAGPRDAEVFFAQIAGLIRGDLGSRGCLLVNAIGELAGRDPAMTDAGAALHARYCRAFANALGRHRGRGRRQTELVARRAEILALSTMGLWITSRVDPGAAADACDRVVTQIREWTKQD